MARTTYPSHSYYEWKAESIVGSAGVLYIPHPPTEDEEGILFCNIEGTNETESDISIGVKPGGTLAKNCCQFPQFF